MYHPGADACGKQTWIAGCVYSLSSETWFWRDHFRRAQGGFFSFFLLEIAFGVWDLEYVHIITYNPHCVRTLRSCYMLCMYACIYAHPPLVSPYRYLQYISIFRRRGIRNPDSHPHVVCILPKPPPLPCLHPHQQSASASAPSDRPTQAGILVSFLFLPLSSFRIRESRSNQRWGALSVESVG